MSELSVSQALDELLVLRSLIFAVTVERRPARPAGEPTRLQRHLLSAISERGALAMSEIVAFLEAGPATASQLISALESRGWVVRSLDPTDRRRHSVALTPLGEGVLQRARTDRRSRLRRVLERLTGTERAQLVALTRRLAEVVESDPTLL